MLSTFRWQNCHRFAVRARPIFTSSVRRHAATLPKSVPRPHPPTRLPPGRATPRVKAGPTEQKQFAKFHKIELVEQLYEAGYRELYRASKRLTVFRAQCYGIAACAATFCYWALTEGVLSPEYMKRREFDIITRAMYWVLTGFMGAVFGWMIIYSGGHVQSVKLIKQSSQVCLQLTIRGRLPFYRYTQVVRPFDLYAHPHVTSWSSIPQYMVTKKLNESSPSAVTGSVIANTSRALGRGLWYIFSSTKQLINQAGIVSLDCVVQKSDKERSVERLKIDLAGQYLGPDETKASDNTPLWQLVTVTRNIDAEVK